MAGEADLSNDACLWRHLPAVDMLHVGAVCIIDLEVALMEPVDEVLLGRPCAVAILVRPDLCIWLYLNPIYCLSSEDLELQPRHAKLAE